MGNVEIPGWLQGLPLAPIYYPTETEFADPIAYISKIEKEARAFGICKVVPPLPKPSKRYVLSNLNKSLAKSQELSSGGNGRSSICRNMGSASHSQLGHGDDGDVRAIFTTRHQELGCSSRKIRGTIQSVVHRQVWESGGKYTLDQFDCKSKIFARNHLGAQKDVSPLVIETLFWKAASEKPIYVEYANDVPGSGFGEPEEPFRYFHRRNRKRKFYRRQRDSINCEKQDLDGLRDFDSDKKEGSSTLENDSDRKSRKEKTPTNLILENTEVCPQSSDLHIEDGSKLTRHKSSRSSSEREGTAGWKLSNSPWNLQVIARSPGSLTRFMPDEVPGVTSPMVYIGMLFSWFAWHVEDHELHSLNFLHTGSPKTWYGVPGDAASSLEEVIRLKGYGGNLDRLAALTILGEKTTLLSPEIVVASGIPCCRLVQNPGEFVVTFPRAYHLGFSHGFNCGEAANFATPQWLKVAKEAAVRRAAMNYLPMLSHQQLLYMLSVSFASRLPRALLPAGRSSRLKDQKKQGREMVVKKEFIADIIDGNNQLHSLSKESTCHAVLWDPESLPCSSGCASPPFPLSPTSCAGPSLLANETNADITCLNEVNYTINDDGTVDTLYMDDDVLPSGLHADSGPLVCVACGILGFPFMAIIQPSETASRELFSTALVENRQEFGILKALKPHSNSDTDTSTMAKSSDDVQALEVEFKAQANLSLGKKLIPHNPSGPISNQTARDRKKNQVEIDESNRVLVCDGLRDFEVDAHMDVSDRRDLENTANYPMENFSKSEEGLKCALVNQNSHKIYIPWNLSEGFLRPRLFCLEHALEVVELLKSKGGANVLIICHSDYPKIKEQAISIARDISVDFDCKDIPFVTASELDLGLIHISIDDEQHVDCREDWTLKLGVNLQHCVNVRKLPLPKQERHALALGGIFSEIVPASNFSSVKWQSRKFRSRHKAASFTNYKLHAGDQIKNTATYGCKSCDIYIENHVGKDQATFNNETVLKQTVSSCGCGSKYAVKDYGEINRTEDAVMSLEPENDKGNPFVGVDCSNKDADGSSKPEELPVIAISTVESSEVQHKLLTTEETQALEESSSTSSKRQEIQITEETKALEESSFTSSEGQQGIQVTEETKTVDSSGTSAEGQQEIQITEGTNPLDELSPKCFKVQQDIDTREEVSPLAMPCSSQDGMEKDVQIINPVPTLAPKKYFKRKRDVDQETIAPCFVRGPCEGLRPRPGQIVAGQRSAHGSKPVKKEKMSRRKERSDCSSDSKESHNRNRSCKCDLQWCHMSFRTKGELALHKRNECVHKGCGKRFASHKYLVQHQCVHAEERPLKCPWKGCNMSFKWVWARTEHVRVHTGERPYACTFVGCGRTFRFVSDFSRHKRKTGHNTNMPT